MIAIWRDSPLCEDMLTPKHGRRCGFSRRRGPGALPARLSALVRSGIYRQTLLRPYRTLCCMRFEATVMHVPHISVERRERNRNGSQSRGEACSSPITSLWGGGSQTRTVYEGHYPGGRKRNPPLSTDPGGFEAAPADLRQADDLLSARRAHAGGNPRHSDHLDAARPAAVQGPAWATAAASASRFPMPSSRSRTGLPKRSSSAATSSATVPSR